MQTPGEILAAARKKRDLTLTEVAGLTKIPEAMVMAVEADEYHKLSGPLYVKSFLRTIAQAVGEDPRRVLDLYGDMTGGEQRSAASQGASVWDAEEVVVQKLGMSWRPWMIYAAGAVVALVIILFAVRGCRQQPPAERTTIPASATVDTSSATTAASPADSTEQQSSVAVPATVPCPRGGDFDFTSGRGDLTLLLRMPSHTGIQVRVDGEHDFAPAVWPAVDGDLPVFPGGSVESGRVYRCRDGYVVAWRGDDHFGLKLDRVEGVEVLLQDRPCTLVGLRPGQEIILDRHSVGL
ncbi:hypothetical protein GW813_01985 [bacterium]|nr:hypothetical protein [bacterium]PJA76198.1 MAG: hypothetical protein CO151_03620 [bacterium CG_4_9_14_3_um_filter_65_15]